MDQQQFPQETYEQPEKQGLSGGAKIGIGCGVLAVIIILLICGGIFGVGWWYLRQAENFVSEYEQQNYTVVRGDERLRVTETVTEPTVFFAQQEVIIDADVRADIAIATLVSAEINGRIEGDVDFHGVMLTIGPDAVVTGDVRPVRNIATIEVRGTVEGTVTGGQVIEQPRTPSVPEPENDS